LENQEGVRKATLKYIVGKQDETVGGRCWLERISLSY